MIEGLTRAEYDACLRNDFALFVLGTTWPAFGIAGPAIDGLAFADFSPPAILGNNDGLVERFVEQGRHVARCFPDLSPQTELVMNWHLEVIAAKLTAVREGLIRRLIINLPPPRHLRRPR